MNYLNPLVWVRMTFDTFMVIVCLFLLGIVYFAWCVKDWLMSLFNKFKVLFFRATALGGWCLMTVSVGIGVVLSEMWKRK